MTLVQLCNAIELQCLCAKRGCNPALAIDIIHKTLIAYQESLEIPLTKLG